MRSPRFAESRRWPALRDASPGPEARPRGWLRHRMGDHDCHLADHLRTKRDLWSALAPVRSAPPRRRRCEKNRLPEACGARRSRGLAQLIRAPTQRVGVENDQYTRLVQGAARIAAASIGQRRSGLRIVFIEVRMRAMRPSEKPQQIVDLSQQRRRGHPPGQQTKAFAVACLICSSCARTACRNACTK